MNRTTLIKIAVATALGILALILIKVFTGTTVKEKYQSAHIEKVRILDEETFAAPASNSTSSAKLEISLAAVSADGLTNAAVERTFQRHKPQLHYCLERAEQSGDRVVGDISVSFDVETSGRIVAKPRVEASLEESLLKCIESKMHGWQWSPLPQKASVMTEIRVAPIGETTSRKQR